MANYRYAYNGPEEGTAKAVLRDGAISTKVAIEMCNFLRGKSTEKAKAALERVLAMKEAIPFKRFTDGVGHRKGPGMASGRYPQKASEAFLALIKIAEANAAQKGLAEELVISHLAAHKASTPFHFGRLRRRQMKRTHVEIVVKEDEKLAKKATKKVAPKKTEAKKPVKEEKAAEKKEAPKTETKKAEGDAQ